jgi:hypothetical protein
VVESAVKESLAGPLGEAFAALAGGREAELWECSAIISAQGSAPQILHGDTPFSDHPQV